MEKEPIRIAQIIGKWVGGGVEAVVMNYYRHVDKSKIQFDFICDSDSINIPYEEIESLGGKVILIPPYQKIFKYHKELKKVLKEGKYKIVHSHINTLSVFPLFAAKCAKVPVRIAHSHSIIINNKIELKRNIIKNILKHFSRVFATDYFACSDMAAISQFGKKTFEKGKITIINNAIDLDKFKYDEKIRKEIRIEFDIKDTTFLIGNIGRLVATKNQKYLINLFEDFKKYNIDSKLIIVGHGPLENKLKELVNEKKLNDFVIFTGQRDDVYKFYSAFDLFILPSLYEGLGITLVEAQANGLVSLASDNVPEEVNITGNVFFVKCNEKQNLEDIINSKNINRKNIDNLLTKSKYDIKSESKKLEERYLNMIEKVEKINICHVVSGLISGGVETMIYNYCSNIDSSKFNFHLLYQHNPSEKNVKELKSLNFNLLQIPSKTKHPVKNYIETYKYFKKNKIDIVHCHMTLMNFIPLLAAKKAGVPIRISHSHTNNVSKKNVIVKLFNNFCRYLSVKFGNVYLACGNEAGKYLYKNKVKFNVIYNALDLKKYEFDKNKRIEIREKYGIKDNEILIGHVGRFVHVKNHVFILNLLNNISKNNPNYKLMLVGDGELHEEIKNIICELKLEDKVIMTGIQSNVQDYYNSFDIFILPSLFEGMPMSAVEAQANGLYCLLSNRIDKNAKINLDKTSFIKLDIKKWEEIIEKIPVNYDRKIKVDYFNIKNLNILEESKKLEQIYLRGKK